MGFAVTVLGSSAMFATLERAASGYLLEIDGTRIWLDAGGGSYRNLLQHISYQDIDGVILTHRHPDHTIDVFQAFHSRRYGQREGLKPIPLWAPAETIERVTAFISEMDEAFDLTTIAAGEAIDIAGAKVSFVRMAHPPETLGVRLEHGDAVLAYSADTGAEADFHTLAGGADIFLCEATHQNADEIWEGHLRASQAAGIATEVGVDKLVLTHLPPGRDHEQSLSEAKEVRDEEIVLAADGDRLELA